MEGVLMLKNHFWGAALTAVLLAISSPEAKASTVFGFYSLDGGATITPMADASANPSVFAFVGDLGTAFTLNILSAIGQPNAGPNLLSVTTNSTHSGTGTDTLSLYFVAADLTPGGSLTFTSQFSSNAQGGGLSLLASTYLGTPTAPGTALGSALFPPLLSTGSSITSAVVPSGFTLTGQLNITATGDQLSNAGITVSAVPGPVLGAGLPGLIMACGGLLVLARRRRREAV
jgi:hypothetical protein